MIFIHNFALCTAPAASSFSQLIVGSDMSLNFFEKAHLKSMANRDENLPAKYK